jgi:nicotinamide-nucleotide amidase
VGESDLEQMLPDLIRRGRTPTVGITASQATLTLRITAEGATAEACDAAMEPTVDTIRQCLGDLIYGEDDEELQHAVVRQLQGRRQTLATAEGGSGGLLAFWLSEADPSRRVYRGGWIGREEAFLRQLAGTRADGLAAGAEATAHLVRGLAQACRAAYGTDHALAVGPFPDADSAATGPGRVCLAIAASGGVQFQTTLYAGHPDILTARTVKTALNFLRLKLNSEEA